MTYYVLKKKLRKNWKELGVYTTLSQLWAAKQRYLEKYPKAVLNDIAVHTFRDDEDFPKEIRDKDRW